MTNEWLRHRRVRQALVGLSVTGALVGGGTAAAFAATGPGNSPKPANTYATPGGSGSTTTTTPPSSSGSTTNPPSSSSTQHNCPNMGGSSSSSSSSSTSGAQGS